MKTLLDTEVLLLRQTRPNQNRLTMSTLSLFHYDTGAKFNSWGLNAPWTISWTVRFRRHTSDSSSIETVRVFISAPVATFDNVCKKLVRSTSVTAVNGTNEMQSFAHSTAFIPYARVRASSAYVTCGTRRPSFRSNLPIYVKTRVIDTWEGYRIKYKQLGLTVSSRELGSAPVKQAIRILVMLAPRGIITVSLIDWYCSPGLVLARSKISDKKVNMELEASLQESMWKVLNETNFNQPNTSRIILTIILGNYSDETWWKD